VRSRVLIVDDHDEFRSLAAAMLIDEGFDVVGEATDGVSAMAAVHALEPEIVLLDVRLPDIDGIAVAHELDRRDPQPAVVLVSSREARDFGARLRAAPARGFIAKDDLSGDALRAVLAADS